MGIEGGLRLLAEGVSGAEPRLAEHPRAQEQKQLAQGVYALRHPMHGGLGKIPAGEVAHHHRAYESHDEQGDGFLLQLAGDIDEAGRHAQVPQHSDCVDFQEDQEQV